MFALQTPVLIGQVSQCLLNGVTLSAGKHSPMNMRVLPFSHNWQVTPLKESKERVQRDLDFVGKQKFSLLGKHEYGKIMVSLLITVKHLH